MIANAYRMAASIGLAAIVSFILGYAAARGDLRRRDW